MSASDVGTTAGGGAGGGAIRVERKPLEPAELVCFTAEQPVPPSGVEAALTALWRSASDELQGAGGGGLAQAALWTLVAFHANPKRGADGGADGGAVRGQANGTARVRQIDALLERVTSQVPARVIHLEQWRADEAPAPGREIEAWVGTHCLVEGGTPRMLCQQGINLAGYGERGRSHFPALVRALVLPDLPTALLWLDDVPRRSKLLGQLLHLSAGESTSRLLIDCQHTSEPESLLAVQELIHDRAVPVVDLGWLRLTPLRYLVAEFFDPPGRAAQLLRLERVELRANPRGRNTALLLLGWLLSRCRCSTPQAVAHEPLHPQTPQGQPQTGTSWILRGPSGPVSVRLHGVEQDGGLDGIIHVELCAGGDTFRLYDVDAEHMAVEGPDRVMPAVPLRERDAAGLIVAALEAPTADPIFAAALDMAARLIESEQWMR